MSTSKISIDVLKRTNKAKETGYISKKRFFQGLHNASSIKRDKSTSIRILKVIKRLRKVICLFIYYSIGIRLPAQPMPGYSLAFALRRLLVRYIAQECGVQIYVKKGSYLGQGIGLKIGDRAQLGQNSKIGRNVTIGNDVVMGPDVVIMTDTHKFEEVLIPINKQGSPETAGVVIGNDVWVGTRVIIMPGITIGDKAVIGAGAVVTKDIPERGIAVGIPAKVIRFRGNNK